MKTCPNRHRLPTDGKHVQDPAGGDIVTEVCFMRSSTRIGIKKRVDAPQAYDSETP